MQKIDKKAAIRELLEVSRKLLSSARIFHLEQIQKLQKRRSALVAIIWDVPDGDSLESFSEKFGIETPVGLSISDKDRAELQLLDKELRLILNHHLKRINADRNMLRKGEKMIRNVRNVYTKQEDSRFNRYG